MGFNKTLKWELKHRFDFDRMKAVGEKRTNETTDKRKKNE